ncbi:3-hydroxyacyl-CoA dehydrogenase [Jiella sp. MQZ9-1]|uniref:3-hydroxyacyl-CoA dehydrogenase n=1 Tax=Jiella flava TaxID=2816857 RepID=A0A939JYA8_9HYPH|nr:3-hydroxyacyl-CoA dehydrogenase [Jiella flava]MBO0664221.1 3-hydroxyacyl-CoA dehydrogenase [Jiella flava]MCD2472867.1 3-hydroxyacyl-CoA dehydrogenase [Jiella flava]
MATSGTTVAVVGAGLIGRAWAITFARAGCIVRLWDPDPQAAPRAGDFVRTVAEDLAASDLLGGLSVDAVLAALRPVQTLEEALDSVAWVQECGPEKIAVKRETFARLDALAAPEAILASSSSALLPSAIAGGLAGAHRCVVAHPINPPYLVPAVELVPSAATSLDTMRRGEAFLKAIGQVPLVMAREIDGFIMNRLQGALLEEAFRLVAGGYASPQDVDRGIADGLALRWSFIGPFETIDLNAPGGVADYVARYQPLYAGLFEQMRERVDWAGPVLDTVVSARRAALAESELAERQVWRDRRLMALRAHKRNADEDIGR